MTPCLGNPFLGGFGMEVMQGMIRFAQMVGVQTPRHGILHKLHPDGKGP